MTTIPNIEVNFALRGNCKITLLWWISRQCS